MEKDKTVDSYMREKKSIRLRRIRDLTKLKSMHSRTRGHLVAAYQVSIAQIYNISGLDQSRIAKVVENLLEGDQYICRRATRDVSVCTPSIRYPTLK